MGWEDLSLKDWCREAFLWTRGEGGSTRWMVAFVWQIAKEVGLRDSVVPQTFHFKNWKNPLTVVSNTGRILEEMRLHGEITKEKEKISDFGGLKRKIWHCYDQKTLERWYRYHRDFYRVKNPVWKKERRKF